MARTGAYFASEHFGLVPDLITSAKGIAGGLPLAGVTGRAEIMDASQREASAAPSAANRWRAPPRSPSSTAFERDNLLAEGARIEKALKPALEGLRSRYPSSPRCAASGR